MGEHAGPLAPAPNIFHLGIYVTVKKIFFYVKIREIYYFKKKIFRKIYFLWPKILAK